MKKIILIFIVTAFSSVLSFAQNETIPVDSVSYQEVFTVVEQMPEFPGGETALNAFLTKNLKYPQLAKDQEIMGKVWMSFVVGKDGTISNIEVRRGIGGGCDEESIRVLKLMPKWKPGYQGGRPVAVKFIIPINFNLK